MINQKDKSAPSKRTTQKTIKPIAEKTNKGAFTLDEVQIFIVQHNARKAIILPGRKASDIEKIHEAYNKSTYKYAKDILVILDKWAQN